MSRRGGVLLEVLIAITVFVASVGVVLGVTSRAQDRATDIERRQQERTIALAVLAKLRSGELDVVTASGDAADVLGDEFGGDGQTPAAGYTIEVERETSGVDGIDRVRVVVVREGEEASVGGGLWALVPVRSSGWSSAGFGGAP